VFYATKPMPVQAGPIKVKRRYTCKQVYIEICMSVFLFVAMAIKAVHLEMVMNLTTTDFLAALRFVARRGCLETLATVNDRNFVGAQRELQRCISFWTPVKFSLN